MKTILISLLFFFSIFKICACDCDTPKSIVEYQVAKYVFEGKAISKKYAKDSLSYTITFKILKHYKRDDNPKTLTFTLKSEGNYSGVWTSCDWRVEKNQKWLVYANEKGNSLTFNYFCSNSRPIEKTPISTREQKILDNAKHFEVEKYTFNQIDGRFTNARPKANLDSLLSKYKNKKYGESYKENRADVMVDIDKNGNLIAANLLDRKHQKIENLVIIDSLFDLNKTENSEERETATAFEEDIEGVVKQLKNWEITFIKGTKIPVKFRKYLQFYKKPNTIEVNL